MADPCVPVVTPGAFAEPAPDAKARQDAPAPPWDPAELESAAGRLDTVRDAMLALERELLERHTDVHPNYVVSVRNLAHYLALRRQDLRDIQGPLRRNGLSSLGRAEGQALANVDAVRRVIRALLGHPWAEPPAGTHPVGMEGAWSRIDRHASALFGPRPVGRRTHLMVTLPTEAATDARVTRGYVAAGMSVARINCSHDGPDAWAAMAARVREAAAAEKRECRVLMDLSGPKLRTGAISPGLRALHWSPERDARGTVLAPARVLLSAASEGAVPPPEFDAVLYPPAAFLSRVAAGDAVELVDLKGRSRRLPVAEVSRDGVVIEATETAWVDESTRLRLRKRNGRLSGSPTPLGPIAPAPRRIEVYPGTLLVLTREGAPGRPALKDAKGRVVGPPRIPCTLPEVFDRVKPGDAVWIDDGRVGGRVSAVIADGVIVEIVHARPDGSRIASDKGINLPDTDLGISGFTEKDRADLGVAVRHADILGLSFVSSAAAVHEAWGLLRAATERPIGLMLKIETRRAFERLPELLLAGMTGHPFGVMIARGDLAVECGFARLAEVQEEILWLCEAAHVPVVWATQVLETLTKKGIPTRAEVTDAAMAERSECAMLNKGPYVLQAMQTLDDILRRMQGHVRKKQPMLRSLSVSWLKG